MIGSFGTEYDRKREVFNRSNQLSPTRIKRQRILNENRRKNTLPAFFKRLKEDFCEDYDVEAFIEDELDFYEDFCHEGQTVDEIAAERHEEEELWREYDEIDYYDRIAHETCDEEDMWACES
ncbi:hypothetical protein PCE1_001466 [Barthelona sp. PCE]